MKAEKFASVYKVFSVGFVCVLSACATASTVKSSGAPAQASLPEPKLEIIDAHTHAKFGGGKERSSGIEMTEARYFQDWKEAGVVGAVAHVSRTGKDFHPSARSKNVIFCAGSPAKPDFQAIEKGLKDKSYGCIKVYLGYVHQFASDPKYRPLYELARKYKVPVVFHTGDTYDIDGKLKYADPLTLDEIAVDYRDVNFVIAHLGNPWIQSAAEVAYKNPNVYVEVSALMVGDMDELPPEKVDEFVVKPVAWAFGYIENPKKLMFGTDWPITRIEPYVRAVKKAVPREHWQAVFHDNAKQVFGFK